MLGTSIIRYICDTQNLNIIYIILYFDLFKFFIIISITTEMLLF